MVVLIILSTYQGRSSRSQNVGEQLPEWLLTIQEKKNCFHNHFAQTKTNIIVLAATR